MIINNEEIANHFVKIGPHLSEEMPNTTASVLDFISTPNEQSMFLTLYTKDELLNTVK